MLQLNIHKGLKVKYKDEIAIIIKIVDINIVTIQILDKNLIYTLNITELEPFDENTNKKKKPVVALTDEEWDIAKYRYNLIQPIIEGTADLQIVAKDSKIHPSTIYRWINRFKEDSQLSSLVKIKKSGGKNKSRLDLKVEEIIDDVIKEFYLTSSKYSIEKVIRKIKISCKELDLKIPHSNTIRNRIKNLSEEEVLRGRYGKKIARDKFEPIKGNFPGANYPLSVIQIDHTCLDIILVDELYRKPFKRPYLTVAIDVYSRMLVGYNLSFDPPGEMGTGLCISNAILAKENLLVKYDIDGDWPCWGIMNTIHMDNAKEFRGNMLKRVCENYGINIEHRPVATPHWGGHVERLLGTFSKEIHNLSGTTFSKIKDRENYDSAERASLTITEFEKWLLTYIVKIYHLKIHSSLNMSPLEKYKEGILGKNGLYGTGIPPKIIDERRLQLDFMPYFERTIQEYGVLIDHIYYYDDVLRKYIHSKENTNRNSNKYKFIFKRDPRDISLIYFYDPNLEDYYEIPYRDTSKPPISIWEYNEVVGKLKKRNIELNEDVIFQSYSEMEEIEMKAIKETKKLKRFSRLSDTRNFKIRDKISIEFSDSPDIDNINENILPFDDIDDEAFT